MNTLSAFVSWFSNLDIPLEDILAVSQVFLAALLAGFVAYHLERIKKEEALKAEKVAIKEKTYYYDE